MSGRSTRIQMTVVNGIPGLGDMSLLPSSALGNTDHIGEVQFNASIPNPNTAEGLIHRLYGMVADTGDIEFLDTAIFPDLENSGRWSFRTPPIFRTGTKFSGFGVGREVQSGIPAPETVYMYVSP